MNCPASFVLRCFVSSTGCLAVSPTCCPVAVKTKKKIGLATASSTENCPENSTKTAPAKTDPGRTTATVVVREDQVLVVVETTAVLALALVVVKTTAVPALALVVQTIAALALELETTAVPALVLESTAVPALVRETTVELDLALETTEVPALGSMLAHSVEVETKPAPEELVQDRFAAMSISASLQPVEQELELDLVQDLLAAMNTVVWAVGEVLGQVAELKTASKRTAAVVALAAAAAVEVTPKIALVEPTPAAAVRDSIEALRPVLAHHQNYLFRAEAPHNLVIVPEPPKRVAAPHVEAQPTAPTT